MRFGIQTALQDTDAQSVIKLWRKAELLGFEWVSGWDHFGGVAGGHQNLDGVVMHTIAASVTSNVRVGSLTYCVDYRPLPVLAKTITTIDQMSGGRVTLGLGAGYLASEYERWGYHFTPPAERLDRLEEMVMALRLLLTGEQVDFDGRHFRLDGAVCDPASTQPHLPIWIGGGGERRTIPMAARLADGWNIPMADPDTFDRKRRLLDQHTEQAGRNIGDLERSVNIGLCWDEHRLHDLYGDRAEVLRPAILTGSLDQVLTHLAKYRAAGADWVMISMRSPFDLEGLERFAEEVLPVAESL